MRDINEPQGSRKRAPTRKRRSRKQLDFLFDRARVGELSKLARLRHPDGGGDYTLPETPTARHLAIAIITHLLRRPGGKAMTLFQFCRERAPWLDPDEVGLARLRSDKALALGDKLRLTAAERTHLRIRTIAPCDQTAEQRAALQRERKRARDRERQRQKREAAGRMTRRQYEATSMSQTRPWEALSMSRRTWERRRLSGTLPSPTVSAAPLRDRDASPSPSSKLSVWGDTLASRLDTVPRLGDGPAVLSLLRMLADARGVLHGA
jgi:hypothetical protein